MALNDKATLVVNVMNFYTAEAGKKPPTVQAYTQNKEQALTGWTNIGHTSLDSPFKITTEGGDVSVQGSLQNHALRTSTTDKTYALELELNQFDKDTLKRYLGANAVEKDGFVYAKTRPASSRVALLGIAEDENGLFGIHGGSVDISANGDIDVSSIEDLASLPIKFTFLEDADGKSLGLMPVTAAPVSGSGH
ncbi:hypothetical protein [Schaalia sp. ZJ1691]|uniref:phage tail tube protein n=1 Tax=Schaalia sp. ZJ1691 TaxID=2709404 RepID=UPI0013ECF01A|nr:hypothetical protein [Schaalia sp. ZJ1691]